MALVCEARGFGDLVRLELVQPYEVAGAATYAEPVYEDPAYEEAEYAEAEYDDGSGGEEASGGSYVVQSGDTLSGIAAELGTSVDSLMAANGLTAPTSSTLARRSLTEVGREPPHPPPKRVGRGVDSGL